MEGSLASIAESWKLITEFYLKKSQSIYLTTGKRHSGELRLNFVEYPYLIRVQADMKFLGIADPTLIKLTREHEGWLPADQLKNATKATQSEFYKELMKAFDSCSNDIKKKSLMSYFDELGMQPAACTYVLEFNIHVNEAAKLQNVVLLYFKWFGQINCVKVFENSIQAYMNNSGQ